MTQSERQELQQILVDYVENPRKMGTCITSIEDLFRRVHSRWNGFRHQQRNIEKAISIINRIAEKHDVTIEKLMSRQRSQYIVDARDEACIELYNAGYSYSEIAKALNRHNSTIGYVINRIMKGQRNA